MAGILRSMQGQYLGILVLMGLAAVLCGAMVTLSWLLGPKKSTPYKSSPYECGVEPVGDTHERFPIKFYLVAIVFILFDIEAVFLWSWYTVFKGSDTQFMVFSFFEFIAYMATWILGYAYAIRVGAIDWDETTNLGEVDRIGAPAAGEFVLQENTLVGVGGGTK
jgi:NADH-quinone oxidoreductase subunit A